MWTVQRWCQLRFALRQVGSSNIKQCTILNAVYHTVAEEGQNAKYNHFSPLIACFLISSLLFCISAATLCCSSAWLAFIRASSSAAAAQIGLSDFEYSFSLRTKLLKSSCLCPLCSRFRFWSSGLNRYWWLARVWEDGRDGEHML